MRVCLRCCRSEAAMRLLIGLVYLTNKDAKESLTSFDIHLWICVQVNITVLVLTDTREMQQNMIQFILKTTNVPH